MAETYTNRLQIMVSDKTQKAITKARGDVPESIFLRKKLDIIFK